MDKITVGVLTVSDRCSRGDAEDSSGPGLKSLLERGIVGECAVVKSHLVPDRAVDIERVLREWSGEGVNLILTTGGTGIARTDVTPEATTAVVDRLVPGISALMFKKSSEVTALAALSRSVAGIRERSLIVNLPGSRKASEECLKAVAEVIPHAIDLILGRKKAVERVHGLQKKRSSVNPNKEMKTVSPYRSIPVKEAQEMILKRVFLIKKEVVTEYKEALGHVLAQEVVSKVNLPPSDVSLKDGFAIRGDSRSSLERRVIGESKAGDGPSDVVVTPETCVRIGTGAPLPPGADTVLMVEKTCCEVVDGKEIMTARQLPPTGEDVRKKGSDFGMGNLLLPCGTYVDAAAVGLCAAAGITSVRVFRKPLVAVLSTGDELVDPEKAISPGKVWDSNRITLISLLKEHGFEALDRGIVKDTPDDLRDALERAFQEADVVVSTGSMSMGQRDYLKDVLAEDFDAEIQFGRVCMKPGLPTTFATVLFGEEMKLFFGLPGNPASAFVTAHLFLLPALRKISGHGEVLPPTRTVTVPLEDHPRPEDRPQYVRGVLTSPWKSKCTARATGNQRSSVISSCVNANCLLLFPATNLLKTEDATALLIGEFPFRA